MKSEHQIETRKREAILSPSPPYLGDSPVHVERDENLVGAKQGLSREERLWRAT